MFLDALKSFEKTDKSLAIRRQGVLHEFATIFFIDYNRIMPKYIPKIMISKNKATNDELKGMVVSPGKAIGKVVIANEENLGEVKFDDGDILVCDVTDVRYLPLMRKAGAIVTGRGGVLSHAAIVARELKKPCIVGVSHALSVLKDGNMIEVDAKQNLINIILLIQVTQKAPHLL